VVAVSFAGIYTFTLDGTVKVQARFSFILTAHSKNGWIIRVHHSSQLPGFTPSPRKGARSAHTTPAAESPRVAAADTPLHAGPAARYESTRDSRLRSSEISAVMRAYDSWNSDLKTRPAIVASHYAADAMLLPTISANIRTYGEELKEYFVEFLSKKPQGLILESHVRLLAENELGQPIAVTFSGIYRFSFGVGAPDATARFTYVFVLRNGEFKIHHHHSSVMPELL